MKKLLVAGIASALLLSAASASATELTLSLSGVTFAGGSSSNTVTGSFEYNTVTGDYSNWNLFSTPYAGVINDISPSDPSGLGAATFNYTTTNAAEDVNNSYTALNISSKLLSLYATSATSAPVDGGVPARDIILAFTNSLNTLTAVGQKDDLAKNNLNPSLKSNDGLFPGNAQAQFNGFSGGFVVVTTITNPVPEPEQIAMFLLGLPLVSWFARRKQAA